ncbi:ATP-dependent DNA helicase pif1-like [Lucilia sericata]|uniref:ATP-dependent DNA helicase pif1-like n=1 Tax=Lucilia sericata TaxID=13632 RepID=UPI0018A7ECE4|nr:ATP-dependent DNA helicase pif1-like [Lucilia sericata]
MPKTSRLNNVVANREYLAETNYNVTELQQEVVTAHSSLTNDQQVVYDQVISSIECGNGELIFVDALGGTGKTYLINLLLTKVRSHGDIALAVASSGIAATLLTGGKTAHSTFKIPLDIQQYTLICNISKHCYLAYVVKQCKLIVWDESTMAHKCGFEALNRSLKDIRLNNDIMGGITVLLAGDFRQTLPVVPRGTRADEVKACIKSSNLWQHTLKLSLHENMRVHLRGDNSAAQFSEILLKIGNGNYPQVEGKLIIPLELGVVVNTLSELTAKIYPDICNISNINKKSNDWLCERAILTPKNDRAAAINDNLLNLFDSPKMDYNSIDLVIQAEDAIHYPVEFLNSLNPPEFPNHKIILKIGTPIMLLRNLNPPNFATEHVCV